jgi:hypothetical protein
MRHRAASFLLELRCYLLPQLAFNNQVLSQLGLCEQFGSLRFQQLSNQQRRISNEFVLGLQLRYLKRHFLLALLRLLAFREGQWRRDRCLAR